MEREYTEISSERYMPLKKLFTFKAYGDYIRVLKNADGFVHQIRILSMEYQNTQKNSFIRDDIKSYMLGKDIVYREGGLVRVVKYAGYQMRFLKDTYTDREILDIINFLCFLFNPDLTKA